MAAYEIADAGVREAEVMGADVFAQSQLRMQTVTNDAKRRILSILPTPDASAAGSASKIVDRTSRELNYYAERDSQALDSLLGLIGDEQNRAFEEKIRESKDDLHQLAAASISSLHALIASGPERG